MKKIKINLRALIFTLIWSILPVFAQNDVPTIIDRISRTSELILKMERQNFVASFGNAQKISPPAFLDYDQYYYELNFDIDNAPESFSAQVVGYFRSTVDSLKQIKLNFDSREDISPWENLNVSGNVSGWTLANSILTVNLDTTYQFGENFSISIQYSGIPRSSGFQGFKFDVNKYNSPVISTLSEPFTAQTWWPCKDDPSDKLDSAKIVVTVPKPLVVASNGLLIETRDNADNTTTFTWFEKYPIATYLISLAISNYTVFADSFEYSPGSFMPIQYYVYPEEYNTALIAFQPIPRMLQVYSEMFGMYPFVEEKYGQAQFEWGGAMEHQTCTSIGGVSVNWESIYAHELAHQWFGDLVTNENWHHIWMNEGFASYSEALWVEAAYGKQAYHQFMNATLNSMGSFAEQAIYRDDVSNPYKIFDWTVYRKGMWVLHMLRHVIGDQMFFEIMREYPNHPDFAFKTTTTEKFRDFIEAKSGMDLDWFFEEWIYGVKYPIYEWGYKIFFQGNSPKLYLEIRQKQEEIAPVFTMPIDIVIHYSDTESDTVIVWNKTRIDSFTLDLKGKPIDVEFDPDNWILKKATQITLKKSPYTDILEFRLYQNFPNPFNTITFIPFSLDANGKVTLEVYDITGRKIRTLLQGYQSGGDIVEWDGKNDRGQPVASGIYIYRLRKGNQQQSRKMILLR